MSYCELNAVPAIVPYPPGEGGAPPEGKLWWSAAFPPPEIEQEIYVAMNGLGWGVVKGYAACDGFLAVRVLFKDPPEWHVKQNGPSSIGCIFGGEIRQVLA